MDKLQDARVFTTLDSRNGFFHVDVDEGSKDFTSFITHSGQYKFNKVPFGLSNSPAVFQRFINSVFRQLICKGLMFAYMDDVVIPAKDFEEALERRQLVLDTARDYGLDINFKKCQFLKKRIEFLGYVIKEGKIQPSSTKIAAVQSFLEPKTIAALQSFLGLTGYFRKFIKDYSAIAKPLSDMFRKGHEFKFGSEEKAAF